MIFIPEIGDLLSLELSLGILDFISGIGDFYPRDWRYKSGEFIRGILITGDWGLFFKSGDFNPGDWGFFKIWEFLFTEIEDY